MKNKVKIFLIMISFFCVISVTYAYFHTHSEFINTFKTEKYLFKISCEGGSFPNDKAIVKDNKVTFPNPSKRGYSFIGYSNNQTGNLDYPVNTNISTSLINNKVIYSRWNIINYTITYNLDGGSITGNKTSYNVETNTFTLPQPTKTGYEFLGWTGSNGTTPTKTVTINKGSIGDKSYTANYKIINYTITYNLDGGSITGNKTSYNIQDTFTLPTPTKTGYTFTGWTGSNGTTPTKTVTISNATGNKSYTANWSRNAYTVNYYVNSTLWAQRSVYYGDALENLNAQSALDGYHTFNGWTGWVSNMPANNLNLYASISEAYCRLATGHGPYGNATALLNVFVSAGWTGHIEEEPSYPGQYVVYTDYNLTREQAETQKNYIASHTNYNNYNYPYLYWVGIVCTNGYNSAWTRGSGQASFS